MGGSHSDPTRQEHSVVRLFSHLPHFREQHCLFQHSPRTHPGAQHCHVSQWCRFSSPELCHELTWLQECQGWAPALCPSQSKAGAALLAASPLQRCSSFPLNAPRSSPFPPPCHHKCRTRGADRQEQAHGHLVQCPIWGCARLKDKIPTDSTYANQGSFCSF